MATVDEVKAIFADLLENLTPARRRLLYQQIGRELARSQRRRVKAQLNPDGTAFEPRKPRKEFKKKKGRIKRGAMFRKIMNESHLKLRYDANGIAIGFHGGDVPIAKVHQFGEIGKIDFGVKAKFAQRELLGFTDEDKEMIMDFVVRALSGNKY